MSIEFRWAFLTDDFIVWVGLCYDLYLVYLFGLLFIISIAV